MRTGLELYVPDTKLKDVFGKPLRESLQLAREGLAEFKIPIEDRKRVVVTSQPPDVVWVGEASTSKTQRIYINSTEVASGEIDVSLFACRILHEAIHQVRMQTLPLSSMREIAATEGVASVGDYEFLIGLDPHYDGETRTVDRARSVSPRLLRQWYKTFVQIQPKVAYVDDPDYIEWFDSSVPLIGSSKGDILGINAATNRLEEGWTMAELITAPTDTVLGFAA
jgi:hypothetical protein